MSSNSKLAVHFGGGNIGRGFIAELLHETGYEVIFVDVVDDLINRINDTKQYKIKVIIISLLLEIKTRLGLYQLSLRVSSWESQYSLLYILSRRLGNGYKLCIQPLAIVIHIR